MQDKETLCVFVAINAPPSLLSGLFMEWTDRPSQGLVTSADKTDSGY